MSRSQSNNVYKVFVNEDTATGYTYELPTTDIKHRYFTELTDQVLSAICTTKAHQGLLELAKLWRNKHRTNVRESQRHELSSDGLEYRVLDFQNLLRQAKQDRPRFSNLIINWRLDNQQLASFRRGSDYNEMADSFSLSDQDISLNGRRFYLYTEDKRNNRDEYLVRWMELFCCYMHEMAHLFVTYMSFHFVGHHRAGSPIEAHGIVAKYEQEQTRAEAGEFFEKNVFGGVYARGEDQSGREWANMTGLPTLITKRGLTCVKYSSIHLLQVNLLSSQSGSILLLSSYEARELSPTSEMQRLYNLDPRFTRQQYSGFWDEWEIAFPGRTFAEPGRAYYTNDPPASGGAPGTEEIFMAFDPSKRMFKVHQGLQLKALRGWHQCHKVMRIYDGRRLWKITDAKRVKYRNRPITNAQQALLDELRRQPRNRAVKIGPGKPTKPGTRAVDEARRSNSQQSLNGPSGRTFSQAETSLRKRTSRNETTCGNPVGNKPAPIATAVPIRRAAAQEPRKETKQDAGGNSRSEDGNLQPRPLPMKPNVPRPAASQSKQDAARNLSLEDGKLQPLPLPVRMNVPRPAASQGRRAEKSLVRGCWAGGQ